MDRFLTRPFVVLALATGVTAGFGLGMASFAGAALGVAPGAYWAPLAQAHGHTQLFGFAGLMVFGVALHFLPRLRGAPLAAPGLVPWVLVLFGGGVWLRVVAQSAAPFLAVAGLGRIGVLITAAIPAGGVLTLIGSAVGIGLVARTALSGPPLERRVGLMQVLPLLITAWLGLLAALLVNVLAAWQAWSAWALTPERIPSVGEAPWVVSPALDALAVRLAFLGWLVPMSVAFAARNFPLFLWTRPAPGRWLNGGLAALLAGLGFDVAGTVLGVLSEIGLVLEGGALLWLTAVVGALGSKIEPPGRGRDAHEAALAEITRGPLMDAFVWLAVAGVLLLAGAALPAVGIAPPPEDVARHALGVGFVLLLIVGMALRLIPGFAGAGREVDLRAARVAVWAAQAAALLRAGPPLAVWLLATFGVQTGAGATVQALLALAGVAGAVSLGALWWAMRPALARPRRAAGA